MDNKEIEIEFIDSECLNIIFYERGLNLMMMSEEAKELRDTLIEALSV